LFLSQDIKIKINKTKKLGLEAQTQWFGLQTAQQLVFIFILELDLWFGLQTAQQLVFIFILELDLLELDLTSIIWVEPKYIQSYFFNTSTTQ